MICPKCKNEKLGEDVCPKCGLSQKEALGSLATSLQMEGKIAGAIEIYDQYLRLEPDAIEVLRKKAVCLCLEAMATKNNLLFQTANETLLRGLGDDWNWEKGHQCRVDLFSRFGKLPDLLGEYESVAKQDNAKKNNCEKVVGIIRLVEKFKSETEPVVTAVGRDNEFIIIWKCFWPSLFGALVVWAVMNISSWFVSVDSGNNIGFISLKAILGFSLLSLIFLNILSYRKEKKSGNRRDKK